MQLDEKTYLVQNFEIEKIKVSIHNNYLVKVVNSNDELEDKKDINYVLVV